MKYIMLSIIVVALFTAAACAESKDSEPVIRKALASDRPTLIDFGAGHCIPCKKMKPILVSLEKEYRGRANVIFVDVKEEREMSGRYRIQLIPTQVFYDAQGKEVKRHMGFMDKQEIVAEFNALGVR